MHLSLRFIIPLAACLALGAWAALPVVDELTTRWAVRDLDERTNLIAGSLQEPLPGLIRSGSRARVQTFLNRMLQDERLYAIGVCDPGHAYPLGTTTFPAELSCQELAQMEGAPSSLLDSPRGTLHVSVKPLEAEGQKLGSLALIHDMSYTERRSAETKRYIFYFLLAIGAAVSLVTVIVAELSWRGWVEGTRALLRGEGLLRPFPRIALPELRPMEKDLRALMRELESDFRPRDDAQLAWTPETLRGILRHDLRGEDVLVVSNREPYIHVRRGGQVEVQRPASGLVTALEPIMRACSGTWIAHGSGSADRDVVDREDRVGVPPEKPAYKIRRVWLTREQESGYYYGLANEGLWPLCHIAHVRPTFRPTDWKQYKEVNRKFAQAVEQEARADDPIVLVQDYHFALLPRMIRERLPDAIIITFWHIPWPNPETFSVCPWREELLDGLLGSSIMGFHTQFHCNNFLYTIDRLLEARIDRETNVVTYRGKATAVKRYPISIEWPPAALVAAPSVADCRREVRRRHDLPADQLVGVGVDRMDYTKGIVERFLAVERLLELEPQWVGRFTFIQIAAPTRVSIPEYQDFEHKLEALARRINARFGERGAPPICLINEHREPDVIAEYYRAAELCAVTSLHDGMNLVAKEFVAAREDEQGVLILSQFTGASRELPEALVVNPYDTDQCAAAMHLALTMPQAEQRQRMRIMRGLVREFNVYRWAGRMLLDAAAMRKRGPLRDRAPATVVPLVRS